jgi:uncharacterized protein involved in exopolysaccharide biosynthesis
MLDRLSVPRRPLDFEDYIDILRRNFGWLIGPVFAGLVISIVVAYSMEDTYISQALIRIVPQQISPELVKNYSAQDIADRINSMAQSVESRNALTNLINSYGLYAKELKSEPLEDVIAKMKSAIGVYPVPGVTNIAGASLPAMQVAFKYRDRNVAQKVCQDLVSRFMNASSQDSLEGQMSTKAFLDDEFEQAKKDLDQSQQQLAEFRSKNFGRLPDDVQMNISQMNALEGRLGQLSEALSRNSDQRMMLESELHIAKDRLASVKSTSPEVVAYNQKLGQLDHDIESTENSIEEMKGRYTEDYPGLQDARGRLEFLKRERAQLIKTKPAKVSDADNEDDNATASDQRLDGQESIEHIQTQLKTNTIDAQRINKEMQALNTAIKAYQSRIESGPAGEKEYADLVHNRDLARERYTDLAIKREKAATSIDLERRKQGETLELLDAANLPDTPAAPKRSKIIPIGAVIGLAVGLFVVAIREVKDTSLKNLKDARLYTQLPILGSVPLLENDVVVQRRKQVMWVGWATATIVGLAIMAGSIAHYYMNKA